MLDVLNFVRGAVSKGDAVLPVLTHYCIYKGTQGWRIQGANGRVAIDAPFIDLGHEAIVPAERFLKAVDNCGGEPELRFTEKGKLVIHRKPFRALLPTQPISTFPLARPSKGDRYPVTDGLLDALRLLRPFIATDAERPWASTILFDAEGNVYASTNAMIAMTKCDAFIRAGDVQLPVFVADELIRLNAEGHGGLGGLFNPQEVSSDDTGTTFYYGDAWVKGSHISAEWPTETAKTWMSMKATYKPIPKGLMAAIEQLIPFCLDPKFPAIFFTRNGIATAPGDTQAEVAGFDLGEACFHADNLRPMLAVSDKMAITERAALFKGKGFQGVMSLLRM